MADWLHVMQEKKKLYNLFSPHCSFKSLKHTETYQHPNTKTQCFAISWKSLRSFLQHFNNQFLLTTTRPLIIIHNQSTPSATMPSLLQPGLALMPSLWMPRDKTPIHPSALVLVWRTGPNFNFGSLLMFLDSGWTAESDHRGERERDGGGGVRGEEGSTEGVELYLGRVQWMAYGTLTA